MRATQSEIDEKLKRLDDVIDELAVELHVPDRKGNRIVRDLRAASEELRGWMT